MEKEFITKTNSSVALNVTGGKIDSFREKEETTGTVRVYEDGKIGIAGCLGTPDENELTKKATEALGLGIPYPCKPDRELEMTDLHDEEIIPVPELIPTMQSFLDRLGERCPKFAFSNKIRMTHMKTEYRNSKGRHLVSSGRDLSIELAVQNRGSGNLFDTFLGLKSSVNSTTLTIRPPISSPGNTRSSWVHPTCSAHFYSILSARCTFPARRSSAGSSARRSSRISCPSATT